MRNILKDILVDFGVMGTIEAVKATFTENLKVLGHEGGKTFANFFHEKFSDSRTRLIAFIHHPKRLTGQAITNFTLYQQLRQNAVFPYKHGSEDKMINDLVNLFRVMVPCVERSGETPEEKIYRESAEKNFTDFLENLFLMNQADFDSVFQQLDNDVVWQWLRRGSDELANLANQVNFSSEKFMWEVL